MNDHKDSGNPIGPLSYVVLGMIVGVFGIGFLSEDNTALGAVALVVGIGLVAFGGIAQAVKLGITSSGRRADREGPRS